MIAEFSAPIRKVGINPYIDPPKRATGAFEIRGYIPVRGTINGKRFTQTPVPIGGGKHRLLVNEIMRKAAGVDVGSRVTVALARNRRSQTATSVRRSGRRRWCGTSAASWRY